MSEETPSQDQENRAAPLEQAVEPSVEDTSAVQEESTLIKIRQEVGKVLVGMEDVFEQVLAAFIAEGHVLLEGVPGLGKTLLVKALAKTFGGQFRRIQFTPDLMPTDVMGHAVYNMKTEQFVIKKGPVFTHLLLADEINRAPAKTQAAMLEVMQEQQVTIEGKAYPVSRPFMVLATQNPLEQEGTYPLPEAQLDRFLMKVQIDYPDEEDEARIVSASTQCLSHEELDVDKLEVVLSPEKLDEIQRKANALHIDKEVIHYAVSLVRQTREDSEIAIGAGPRAGIALVRCAKSMAALEGRDFVIPDDIKQMALPVLRHRVALTPEAEIEGLKVDDVLKKLLKRVEAPRV